MSGSAATAAAGEFNDGAACWGPGSSAGHGKGGDAGAPEPELVPSTPQFATLIQGQPPPPQRQNGGGKPIAAADRWTFSDSSCLPVNKHKAVDPLRQRIGATISQVARLASPLASPPARRRSFWEHLQRAQFSQFSQPSRARMGTLVGL